MERQSLGYASIRPQFPTFCGFRSEFHLGNNACTPQPRYHVVERIGDNIEIRQYPMRIAAETTVDESTSANARGDAFRIVADYIFGANKGR